MLDLRQDCRSLAGNALEGALPCRSDSLGKVPLQHSRDLVVQLIALTSVTSASHSILLRSMTTPTVSSYGPFAWIYTVFIHLELGRVGLTETEARAQGRNIRVARLPMAMVLRALAVARPEAL